MLLSNNYPFITDYFTKLLNNKDKPFPQSLLLYGNDIDAQYTLAMEIARLLNCESDKADDCQCLNCKWIREDSHPAVLTISPLDNKTEDDESKTVISIKQAAFIKEMLVNTSDFHRVFIFCGRDNEGNITGLDRLNFQAETANSLLKIIEEPQPDITFIFLTRYMDDLLPTIISRSQCFFIPKLNVSNDYDYSKIIGIFDNYWEFDRQNAFDISQKLQDLAKAESIDIILDSIQNYILYTLKNNLKNNSLIQHIEIVENAKKQAKLGIKPVGIFDDLCLKLIK